MSETPKIVVNTEKLTPEMKERIRKVVAESDGVLAVLNVDLQARIEKLEDLLRPFAEAYRLHFRDDKRVTQLKIAMSMNTSLEDWRAAFVELYGEPVKVDQEVV